MYCKNCGNSLNENNKFCSYCGKEVQVNKIMNNNIKKNRYSKILSSKIMLIMFIINYVLFFSQISSSNDYIVNIITGIIVFPFCIFHSIPIIFSILNIKKHNTNNIIFCLGFSVSILIGILLLKLLLMIFGNFETFNWIFIIQSLLLFLICLFKLIFKVES